MRSTLGPTDAVWVFRTVPEDAALVVKGLYSVDLLAKVTYFKAHDELLSLILLN